MDTPEIEPDTENESVIEKIKSRLRDIVGLPPGDGTPHGQGRPLEDGDSPPPGGLTSDDAEGLPPRAGTGISVG